MTSCFPLPQLAISRLQLKMFFSFLFFKEQPRSTLLTALYCVVMGFVYGWVCVYIIVDVCVMSIGLPVKNLTVCVCVCGCVCVRVCVCVCVFDSKVCIYDS